MAGLLVFEDFTALAETDDLAAVEASVEIVRGAEIVDCTEGDGESFGVVDSVGIGFAEVMNVLASGFCVERAGACEGDGPAEFDGGSRTSSVGVRLDMGVSFSTGIKNLEN